MTAEETEEEEERGGRGGRGAMRRPRTLRDASDAAQEAEARAPSAAVASASASAEVAAMAWVGVAADGTEVMVDELGDPIAPAAHDAPALPGQRLQHQHSRAANASWPPYAAGAEHPARI